MRFLLTVGGENANLHPDLRNLRVADPKSGQEERQLTHDKEQESIFCGRSVGRSAFDFAKKIVQTNAN